MNRGEERKEEGKEGEDMGRWKVDEGTRWGWIKVEEGSSWGRGR